MNLALYRASPSLSRVINSPAERETHRDARACACESDDGSLVIHDSSQVKVNVRSGCNPANRGSWGSLPVRGLQHERSPQRGSPSGTMFFAEVLGISLYCSAMIDWL